MSHQLRLLRTPLDEQHNTTWVGWQLVREHICYWQRPLQLCWPSTVRLIAWWRCHQIPQIHAGVPPAGRALCRRRRGCRGWPYRRHEGLHLLLLVGEGALLLLSCREPELARGRVRNRSRAFPSTDPRCGHQTGQRAYGTSQPGEGADTWVQRLSKDRRGWQAFKGGHALVPGLLEVYGDDLGGLHGDTDGWGAQPTLPGQVPLSTGGRRRDSGRTLAPLQCSRD